MIKILVFMEADISRMEGEINQHMDKYEIAHAWSTGARLVIILKERAKVGRPAKTKEE